MRDMHVLPAACVTTSDNYEYVQDALHWVMLNLVREGDTNLES